MVRSEDLGVRRSREARVLMEGQEDEDQALCAKIAELE